MRSAALLTCCLGLLYAVSGCGREPSPHEWQVMESCLPKGMVLKSEFCTSRCGCNPDERITVKQCLRHLGAYAKKGQLYDSSDKEILFYWMPIPPGTETRGSKWSPSPNLGDLESKYHVIRIYPTECLK